MVPCAWYHDEVPTPGRLVGAFRRQSPNRSTKAGTMMAAKPRPRLRVITFASVKGGVGKSTLCSALAVRASKDSKRVALLDLDPQESLASWWTRRGRTRNPKLHEVDATTEAIELLISEGWEWVFVD